MSAVPVCALGVGTVAASKVYDVIDSEPYA
jgi:hypothetical protein